MPQVECHYSNDLQLDCKSLFCNIEKTINAADSSAGICKSRAYPIKDYLHTHILIRVLVMQKPHRDSAFMQQLQQNLVDAVTPLLPDNCAWSLSLEFSSQYYTTG